MGSPRKSKARSPLSLELGHPFIVLPPLLFVHFLSGPLLSLFSRVALNLNRGETAVRTLSYQGVETGAVTNFFAMSLLLLLLVLGPVQPVPDFLRQGLQLLFGPAILRRHPMPGQDSSHLVLVALLVQLLARPQRL